MTDSETEAPLREPLDKLLRGEVRVVNIGLVSFGQELERANVVFVHLNWSPPAASNPKILSLLSKLSS